MDERALYVVKVNDLFMTTNDAEDDYSCDFGQWPCFVATQKQAMYFPQVEFAKKHVRALRRLFKPVQSDVTLWVRVVRIKRKAASVPVATELACECGHVRDEHEDQEGSTCTVAGCACLMFERAAS